MAPSQKKPRSNDDNDSGIKPPSPSSSVILLSPSNEVLLLHRVKTSSSFASAHVFPGGNVDPFHDGEVAHVGNPARHKDGPAYRLCAIRETFEESGILLAKKDGKLLELPDKEKDEARKKIHAREIKFCDWLDSLGATPDTGKYPT
jgi:8-oxo-dGTP pyrophosphatase MutT (NUDIX family)